tara:strand:+ start:5019 stop:6125 length:1107 start_codon:yes stop_codon:yes gene_type:complete
MKIVKVLATDSVEATATSPAVVAGVTMVDFVITDAVETLIAQGVFASDDDGIFFQRQLEHIQAKSYDVLYPELMGRACFPLNTEGGEGINTITYRSYDKRGETAIIAGKATDLPRGDISGEEYMITVKTLGNAFGYSRQELAAAKVTGIPLEARKAEATRKSYEEKVNQIIWFGSAENKLNGLFNGPVGAPCLTVAKTELANGASGSPQWRNKTGVEIVKDLTDALGQMYSDTKKIFSPNQILMSVEDKLYLENTPFSATFPLTSIMEWFLKNNKFIKSSDQIKDINELEGIYPSTVGGTFDPTGGQVGGFTIMVTGEENARIREPFPYVHLPVQYKGLEFEINCYGRFAGIEMVRPAAFQHFLNCSA